ncbi:MAG: hypothetical protein CMD02_06900 [Flavobacteriales bacterium]|nr:hypothetical protein [Flavobacteriales bacterium]
MVTGENNIISYSSENVNLHNTEKFHLSIEISPLNIWYSFLNTENLEYIFFKSIYTSEISELISHISSEDKLKLNYYSSSISYKNFPSTIIPNKLFDKEKKHKYLDFVIEGVESVKTDVIHQIDSSIVYSINHNLVNSIHQILPNIKEKNSTNIAISQLLRQYSHLKKKTSYLFINTNNIEIIVIENGKLIFQNFFKVSNSLDILYFTLFCFDQLNIDPNKNEVFLFGEVEKGDENYSLLYDYIRNIKFGEISSSLLFNEELNNISNHKYFTLFSQLLCV